MCENSRDLCAAIKMFATSYAADDRTKTDLLELSEDNIIAAVESMAKNGDYDSNPARRQVPPKFGSGTTSGGIFHKPIKTQFLSAEAGYLGMMAGASYRGRRISLDTALYEEKRAVRNYSKCLLVGTRVDMSRAEGWNFVD